MLKKTSAAALALGLPLLFAGPAFAEESFQANLTPLNESGATGTAMVMVNGNQVEVKINSRGLLEGSPHAQHIHFGEEARNECPTQADNKDGDEVLNTVEGEPAYGPIVTSLTTSGDTSPESALAVDRFPVGNASYSRTIDVDQKTMEAIKAGKAAIVQHGFDANGNGEYDMEALGASELDPSLPQEATAPVNCGILTVSQAGAASGGVAAGGGGTTGVEESGLLTLGAASLLGAAVVAVRRRRSASSAS